MTLVATIVAVMMFLLGFLLGWFVEWRIDLSYWHSFFEEAEKEGAPGSVMVLPAAAAALQLPAGSQEAMIQALRDQLGQRDADLEALRGMLEQLSANEAQRRAQEAALIDETRRLRQQLDELTAAKNDTDAEWRHELARREQQWQESQEAELAAVHAENQELKARLSEIKSDADWRAEYAHLEQEWQTSQAEHAGLRAENQELKDTRLSIKEVLDAEWRTELARREMQWQESREVDLAWLRNENQELKDKLEAVEEKFARYRANHPAQLAVIRGIGPKIEAELRRAGINSYAELASRTPDELRLLLNPPKWRKLDFESWIAQAEVLAKNEET